MKSLSTASKTSRVVSLIAAARAGPANRAAAPRVVAAISAKVVERSVCIKASLSSAKEVGPGGAVATGRIGRDQATRGESTTRASQLLITPAARGARVVR